ncbi:MAG TPA: molybdopterin dinucleotide binding domain-containing protein, partial [Nitrospirales bacterium]|nr:molybdopterin dinucleotide binding domain-containing protein [Nitrospirales bacterium]
RGKLCAQGQAGLQELYNPDRITQPLTRDGPRGEGRFVPIDWETAFNLWLERLRQPEARAAFVSRPVSGILQDIFSRLMAHVRGTLLEYDPTDAVALDHAGIALRPDAVADADYVLSFGAPFLEPWLSPVAMTAAYGEFRQGRGSRGRLVQIEPRLSLTAANADRWVPIRPGTEGRLALALAARLRSPRHPLAETARLTDVPESEIARIAEEFGAAARPLALGGGAAIGHRHGSDALTAIDALNRTKKRSDAAFVRRGAERELLALADEIRDGRRHVIHIYDTNPVYRLPIATGFADTLRQADFIVSFSRFMDDTTALADLILPDHSALESWDEHARDGLIGLAQPVVRPLYDTRAVGDVCLDAIRRLGGKPTWPDVQAAIRERAVGAGAPADDARWLDALQRGFIKPGKVPGTFSGGSNRATPEKKVSGTFPVPPFAGDPDRYPFHLHPFVSPTLGDERGANRPWLQQLPDPLTTAAWNSWIEINPATARDLGIRDGEIIRVISPHGALEAPAVLHPGTRPDVVAMPIGNGHRGYGRYAAGRGANPLAILSPTFDAGSGRLATHATRVRVEPTRRPGRLVRLDDVGAHPDQPLIRIGRS